ncbi:MAG: hypothetical protein ACRDDZ_11240 [Marinifilaceae bacterium]
MEVKVTSKTNYRKLDICKRCEGKGKVSVCTTIYPSREYEYVTCEICEGSGMIEKHLEVTIRPHKVI